MAHEQKFFSRDRLRKWRKQKERKKQGKEMGISRDSWQRLYFSLEQEANGILKVELREAGEIGANKKGARTGIN